jgi:hypothetical protein
MAISKIHPIRHSVLDCINYIVDRDKTDGELYVSSFACSVHTADLEFAQTADSGSRHGSVKAQHLIQAFAPGEVDAKTAHEIGKKLALELTNGAHEFVIATHIDKDHVKRIAATYAFLNEHSITSVSQIAKAQEEWAVSIKEKRDQIRSVEAEIDKLKIICEHLENKEKYTEVYASYLDSGKDKSYKEAHLGQMLMFESSCKILSQMGVSPSVTYKETSDRLNDLIRQKDDLYASYHSDVSNLKQLNIAAKNIDILLSRNETSKSKAKYRNKDERISD